MLNIVGKRKIIFTISIILMVIAALVGFFFGAGMNEAMGGAILLSMITGFACTINAIEKNKKD